MPMPIPGTPVLMEMCMKFFDIFQPGRNMHMCMDMEMMINKFKVLVSNKQALESKVTTNL